jgi:hypothetical protein
MPTDGADVPNGVPNGGARYDRRARLIAASLVLVAVLAAAVVETYAVPHSDGPARGAMRAVESQGGQTTAKATYR